MSCERQSSAGDLGLLCAADEPSNEQTETRTLAVPKACRSQSQTCGYPFRKPVRLLGVTLSSLKNDPHGDTDLGQTQLDLGL